MTEDEKPIFARMLLGMADYYRTPLSAAAVEIYWDDLSAHEYESIAKAAKAHRVDPVAGQFMPKVADLIRHINAANPNGHPDPETAWNLLLGITSNETETGFLTDEMREGWASCGPSLAAGDRVAARMAFLESYGAALKRARAANTSPRWTETLGTCPRQRIAAFEEARKTGKITDEYAERFLPAPAASLSDVLALLERQGGGDVGDASIDPAPLPGSCREFRNIARARALMASLAQSYAEDQAERSRLADEKRAAEKRKRDEIGAMVKTAMAEREKTPARKHRRHSQAPSGRRHDPNRFEH